MTNPLSLARCDECNAVPVLALAWDDNRPILVLACDCTEAPTDVEIDSVAPVWM